MNLNHEMYEWRTDWFATALAELWWRDNPATTAEAGKEVLRERFAPTELTEFKARLRERLRRSAPLTGGVFAPEAGAIMRALNSSASVKEALAFAQAEMLGWPSNVQSPTEWIKKMRTTSNFVRGDRTVAWIDPRPVYADGAATVYEGRWLSHSVAQTLQVVWQWGWVCLEGGRCYHAPEAFSFQGRLIRRELADLPNEARLAWVRQDQDTELWEYSGVSRPTSAAELIGCGADRTTVRNLLWDDHVPWEWVKPFLPRTPGPMDLSGTLQELYSSSS